MKKKNIIKLISLNSSKKHFYIKRKGKKNDKKIKIKKFNPKEKKYFIYNEVKIK